MKRTTDLLFAGLFALGLVAPAGAATPLNAILSIDDPEGNMGGARVRVVHASPDAPAVDVWVEGSVVFENIEFEEVSEFVEVPAGTYNVQVVPSGATEPVVIEADLDLAAATDYTVVATDFLANITPIILTADGGTPAAGNAWVRFFHGSPDAPAVDIAVADGGPVLIPNVAFQEFSAYGEVAAGTYDLEARLAGTSDVALSLPGVTIGDGDVVTAYATGLVADIGVLDNFYFIPAAARGEGARSSLWSSDVDVQNAGDGTASYQLLWLPRDTDNAVPAGSDVFEIEAGEAVRWVDVLGQAFGVMDGTDAFGALAVISDSNDLKFFSRTYNTSEDGTFGQAIPGFAADELIPANEMKRILFFTENGDFRSNIGILNGTGSPMTINWRRYTADGNVVEEASADLPAWGNVQLNRVFSGEAPVVGGYIDVWTETEDAAFMAYGSVVDNNTSDPTTVIPQ
jgi:hypothetical protein